MRRLSLIAATCALTACLGDPYTRPDARGAGPVPLRAGAVAGRRRHASGGATFGDPVLDGLVTEALANSKDLRIAAARVDQFQGAKVTTRAPLFPAIGYTGSTGRESRSELVYRAGQRRRAQLQQRRLHGRLGDRCLGSRPQPHGGCGCRLACLRGGPPRGGAGRGGRRRVRVHHAAVAGRPARHLAAHAGEPPAGADGVREAPQGRRDLRGRAVAGALRSTRSPPPRCRCCSSRSRSRRTRCRSWSGAIPGRSRAAARCWSSARRRCRRACRPSVLTQRPDVVSAEQSLIAANARVSAARALYFPSISLTGLLGVASLDLDELFDDGSDTWNYAGTRHRPDLPGRLGARRQSPGRGAARAAARELRARPCSAHSPTWMTR